MEKIVSKHDEVFKNPIKRKMHLARIAFVKNTFND